MNDEIEMVLELFLWLLVVRLLHLFFPVELRLFHHSSRDCSYEMPDMERTHLSSSPHLFMALQQSLKRLPRGSFAKIFAKDLVLSFIGC